MESIQSFGEGHHHEGDHTTTVGKQSKILRNSTRVLRDNLLFAITDSFATATRDIRNGYGLRDRSCVVYRFSGPRTAHTDNEATRSAL